MFRFKVDNPPIGCAVLIVVAFVSIVLAIYGGLGYIAVHFIAKVW